MGLVTGSLSFGRSMRISAVSLARFSSYAGVLPWTEDAVISLRGSSADASIFSEKVYRSACPTSSVPSCGQQTYAGSPGVPRGPLGPSMPNGAQSFGTPTASVPGGIRTSRAGRSSPSWFPIRPGPSFRRLTVTGCPSPGSASVYSPTATRSAVLSAVRVIRRWLSPNPSPGASPLAPVPYSTASVSALPSALSRTGVVTEAPGSTTVSSSHSACLTLSATVE
ncbi:hypothetical protein [Streptomyces sp. NPDC058766]|uniref:hypothetical protein n=1 Tax=Streptomyces sp. NPDC058766 TaxID=3346630 RepID=UPI00369C4B76